MSSSKVETIRTLFGTLRGALDEKRVDDARKVLLEIERLVRQVKRREAAQRPSREWADAVQWHAYALLHLAAHAPEDERERATRRAYATERAAVDEYLALRKRTVGDASSAYNLAIDLIYERNEAERALYYFAAARRVLRGLPREERQYGLRVLISYGVALCARAQGDDQKALRILRGALSEKRADSGGDSEDSVRGYCKKLIDEILGVASDEESQPASS